MVRVAHHYEGDFREIGKPVSSFAQGDPKTAGEKEHDVAGEQPLVRLHAHVEATISPNGVSAHAHTPMIRPARMSTTCVSDSP